MKYGVFDEQANEYVIHRPDTPLPWINYLGCENYCGLMSNTAGGYSFYRDPRMRRLTRYRYNNIPMDRGGRYLYVRDNLSKDFWSASWQPVLKDLKDYQYECRHGMGYTRIRSEYAGIQTETTYFVPLGENLEVWMCTVKNASGRKRDLSVFSFIEFCLWDALSDMTDYQWNLNTGEADCVDGIIKHTSWYRYYQDFFAYFSVNQPLAGFDTQRESFLGPYGSLENPRAVREGKSGNSVARGWSPVGSHCLHVALNPGEEKDLIFVLGYADKTIGYKEYVDKYQSRANVVKELARLKTFWRDVIGRFSVKTPSPEMDVMLNVWNQYQCRTTFNWSRSASYYESGIGRGMGFRDSSQDVLGFVYQIPEKARTRLMEIAGVQYQAGDACHQYSPLTKKGDGRGFSDDHLWLIFGVAAYIKETGDVSLLQETVPFYDEGQATMYEHLRRAVLFSSKDLGPHGLPNMGKADWNDCLFIEGLKAESVLVGMLLVKACRDLAALAPMCGNGKDVPQYEAIAEGMKKTINTVAWTGEYYLRGFDSEGKPFGGPQDEEGRIFLEPQPWAVMSGVADGERARKCMDAVNRLLATEHGILILAPSYSKYHPPSGTIGWMCSGLKENGAVFCHPNPWAMIAEVILGRGDQAFRYYHAILPSRKNDMAELYRVEPYVYPQMIAGKDHPSFGEGKNSWLTGTASWNFYTASSWILGIRAEYDGLVVDPCIPATWDGFSAKRQFRGAVYEIEVTNPAHVSKGVKSVTVDGRATQGNTLPVFADNQTHAVKVVMGSH